METCNLEVDVLKTPILPFLGVEHGDYFFPIFLVHPVWYVWKENNGYFCYMT